MSIILSLAGNGVSDDCPSWDGYGKVIRISGKAAIRIFGTRSRPDLTPDSQAGAYTRSGFNVRVEAPSGFEPENGGFAVVAPPPGCPALDDSVGVLDGVTVPSGPKSRVLARSSLPLPYHCGVDVAIGLRCPGYGYVLRDLGVPGSNPLARTTFRHLRSSSASMSSPEKRLPTIPLGQIMRLIIRHRNGTRRALERRVWRFGSIPLEEARPTR